MHYPTIIVLNAKAVIYPMTDIRSNEREFMSQVVSWLNEFLRADTYPFQVASSDPSVKVSESKTQFSDIQIWLSREAHQGFCGWELMTPANNVDDQALLINAAQKARAMHADYFVTCNMRDVVIWRTPHWTDLYLKDLKARLFEAFFKRTQDHKLAETLMIQVLDKLGLREI